MSNWIQDVQDDRVHTDLWQVLGSNDLVLFAGSGLSAQASTREGARPPLWPELLRRMGDWCAANGVLPDPARQAASRRLVANVSATLVPVPAILPGVSSNSKITATTSLEAALAPLTRFLGAAPLTDSIARLEFALEGCTDEDVPGRLHERGVSTDLLRAGLLARERFGRINDLIHATAIALALPHLLHAGETLRRPSLAAGNDPSRPYDVETDLRIAEFKLARWAGSDAGRKRQLFKDVVHLAAAGHGGRSVELYVLGQQPAQFLQTTTSTAAWALNRMADHTRQLFEQRFGRLQTPIPDFVNGAAAHVEIIDLERRLPQLFAPLM